MVVIEPSKAQNVFVSDLMKSMFVNLERTSNFHLSWFSKNIQTTIFKESAILLFESTLLIVQVVSV